MAPAGELLLEATPTPPKQPAASQQPPPPPPEPETLLSVWRTSWLPLSGAALLAGALGFYIVGTLAASCKTAAAAGPCACGGDGEREHATPTGRPPALTGDNAEQFDKELDLPEWWMGITKLRRRLAEHARGNVLELAMGSGRNLKYYDWAPLTDDAATGDDTNTNNSNNPKAKTSTATSAGITSFTGLDISIDMLDVARKRLTKTVPPLSSSEPIVKATSIPKTTGGQLSFLNNRLRLVHSDAHNPLPSPPPAAAATKYDSIIQTFGLCSVSDPVAVLRNLAAAVKPGTGRIVLLEHGKGFYGLVNGLLDKNAGKHFEKYGCWWNRDIEALVDEAVAKTPGLTIVKVERPNVLQMGTLVWVELKVEENGKK
ncbi:hypothetical protein K4F52_007931 [Lecanicillium sp. MT-2017a]|nr:hypothetical protein K4F52_007931 [Lecanicillium sp. MT-2017a]